MLILAFIILVGSGGGIKKNALMTRPIDLIGGVYNLSYERSLTDWFSLSLDLTYWSESWGFSILFVELIAFRVSWLGVGVTPRFYPLRKGVEGLYIGSGIWYIRGKGSLLPEEGVLKWVVRKIKQEIEEKVGVDVTWDVPYSGVMVNPQIGYNFVFCERIGFLLGLGLALDLGILKAKVKTNDSEYEIPIPIVPLPYFKLTMGVGF